jgi:ubiquinone/menaquinone biosynthesis C-methylase UbiE
MKRRSLKQDKLARVYDTEILPIWAERFGRMLLAEARLPDRGLVLNVACGTGYPALELLARMDSGRIIAIDSSSALLDVARDKAGDLSGKRIFFRTEGGKEKLSFDDDVYDLTFSNLGLGELSLPPAEAIAELARVTAPGGQVLVTLPLQGTWSEFLDIYREVLTKHDRHDTLERLAEYEATLPDPDVALQWMEAAGLQDVDLVVDEFSLLFKSSREFFFAPVIEFGPLRDWKRLAGKGQEMQDIFWFIKEAIDAYFGGRAFSVTVVAGCLRGRKPEEAGEEAGDDQGATPQETEDSAPDETEEAEEAEESPAAEVSGLLSADFPEDISGLHDELGLPDEDEEEDEVLEAFAEEAEEAGEAEEAEEAEEAGEAGEAEEGAGPRGASPAGLPPLTDDDFPHRTGGPFDDEEVTAAEDGSHADALETADEAPSRPRRDLPPPPVTAEDFAPGRLDPGADAEEARVTHPRLDDSSVPLLDTADISIHELDDDDLEVVEEQDVAPEADAPLDGPTADVDRNADLDEDVDEEADTNIRTVEDLPDHLQKAIRDHKDED